MSVSQPTGPPGLGICVPRPVWCTFLFRQFNSDLALTPPGSHCRVSDKQAAVEGARRQREFAHQDQMASLEKQSDDDLKARMNFSSLHTPYSSASASTSLSFSVCTLLLLLLLPPQSFYPAQQDAH